MNSVRAALYNLVMKKVFTFSIPAIRSLRLLSLTFPEMFYATLHQLFLYETLEILPKIWWCDNRKRNYCIIISLHVSKYPYKDILYLAVNIFCNVALENLDFLIKSCSFFDYVIKNFGMMKF